QHEQWKTAQNQLYQQSMENFMETARKQVQEHEAIIKQLNDQQSKDLTTENDKKTKYLEETYKEQTTTLRQTIDDLPEQIRHLEQQLTDATYQHQQTLSQTKHHLQLQIHEEKAKNTLLDVQLTHIQAKEKQYLSELATLKQELQRAFHHSSDLQAKANTRPQSAHSSTTDDGDMYTSPLQHS
ncbi:hypothetical protein BDF20DRAFT_894880, partial [Mycotypha africana]|uniref:uncharacterized protein n=1 Tax=Mycotypha africana TaxID=64632 RepID=UPI00230083D9